MKKIVSLALAGLMSLSLFAIGASADSIEHGKTTTVVGADAGAGAGAGVQPDAWTDSTDSSSDINVKVDKVIHKYAVDITFNLNDLTLGNIEWDVDDMKYKFDTTLNDNKIQTIQLDNRSDLPVYVSVKSEDADENDGIAFEFAATTQNGKATNAKFQIAKATASTTADKKGIATSDTVTLNVTSADWTAVADYYVKQFEDSTKGTTGENNSKTFKLTTITVTLSKSAD